MRQLIISVLLLIVLSINSNAQNKSIQAIKTTQAPKIDGKLDDETWKSAPAANNFIQYFPTPGKDPLAKTEVRILYDDDAVYIGAYLYDDPSLIRKQLTSRDGEQQTDADYFVVFFDTYNDLQNGFQFLVTPANVQTDAKLNANSGAGFGNYGDKTWDAVWQSQTSIVSDGWTVEMRIPYLSLRFSKKDIQTWGLQFARFIRRNSETDFWNPVDPTVSGLANQFGKFENLRNIQPPLRLSFSPYLSGGTRSTPIDDKKKTDWLASGGMDVKWGINESFTLDATIIPDFGQVISDNIINNLSPFEIRFTENRPFFTEGTELFNKANLFYSRRVGAVPLDYNRVRSFDASNPDYEIIKNPSVTQLYNAIKFSGRTKRKLGIGVFNAVTAPMHADLRNTITKSDTTISTEPLTNYNLFVFDQAFKGRSYITFTNTNVMRQGFLRDANVSAFDFAKYNPTNTHAFRGTVRYSKIFGYTPSNFLSSTPYNYISDIEDTTINGRKYIKPYDGFVTTLRYGKISGKIQYFGTVNMESDAYDANDLGYIQAPNEVNYIAGVSYNQLEPKGKFYNYSYNFQVRNDWLYKPYKYSGIEFTASAFWLFRNMWDVRVTLGGKPEQNDFFELRTKGAVLKRPLYFYTFFGGSSDSRKRLFVSWDLGFYEGKLPDNPLFSSSLGLRYRFSNQFTLNLDLNRSSERNQIGFASRETSGEPIVGFRNYNDLSTVLSGTYNFTSRINFTARARHYWSKVHYRRFINVDDEGNHIERAFLPNQDFTFNVFNVDAFFTWDFRLGSRIVVGWKNWLGDDYQFMSGIPDPKYLRNFTNTLDLPHGNELTIRFIYFLDYNQLRKKK